MQLNLRNASFAVIFNLVLFSTCKVFASNNPYGNSVKTEGGISTSILFVSYIFIAFIVFCLLYRLLKERKFRKELISFNNKFNHFNRDSSTLSGTKYQTKQLQRLASYTSQIIDTRNQAIEDLKDSKELLLYHTNLIENISDAIISTNMNSIIKSWNSTATEIFGYRFEQVYGKKLSTILNFKYTNTTRAIVYDMIIKEKYWKGELVFQKPNDDKIYLLAFISLIKTGITSHGFVGIYTNITKRKVAQKAYLESEKYFRTIFNNDNIGNCIFNREGKFEKVNKYLLNLLEYSSNALRVMSFADVIFPNDFSKFDDTFKKIITQEISSTREEIRVKTKSGSIKWLEISIKPIISEYKKINQIICCVVDISDRKKIENALRDSEQKFRKIFNNLEDGFIRIDKNYRILLASPSLLKILEIKDTNNLIGRKIWSYISENRQKDRIIYELEKKGKLNDFRLAIEQRDKQLVVSITATSWFDKSGELAGYEGLLKDVTQQFKAQQALMDSEEKYRTLVEDARIGISISKDNSLIYANNALRSILGYSIHDKIDIDIINKMDAPVLDQNKKLKSGYFDDKNYDRIHHEHDIIRKDGKRVSLLITSSIIRINGEECVQKAYVNVTKKRNAIEALRLQEKKYRLLATNSNDVIWTMKLDLTITYVSPSVKNLMGYSQEEAIAGEIKKLIGKEILKNAIDDYKKNRKNVEKYSSKRDAFRTELEIEKKDESKVWIEITLNPLFDDSEEMIGILVSARDIHNRKNAELNLETKVKYLKGIAECSQLLLRDEITFEEAMEKTIDILRKLFNCSRTYIYENYEDATIGLFAVRKFLVQEPDCQSKIFGSLNRKIIYKNGFIRWQNSFKRGKPIKGVLSDFNEEEKLLLKSQEIKSTIQIPFIVDGSWVGFMGFDETKYDRIWTKDEIRLMKTSADIILSFIERKRAKAKLEKDREALVKQMDLKTMELNTANAELSRAARLKDEFLANMSHELRTPLNAILGMSEALQEQIYGPMNDQELKTLKTIEDSGHHLLELINDVLDLSKISVGKLILDRREISINSLCEGSLRLVKQTAMKKKIKINYNSNCEGKIIYTDERRLKQILINLLSNAIKFTDEKKEIGLDVYWDEDDKKIDFTIWDEGIGISEAELPNLFKPFIQLDSSLSRKHEGTGLGLSLVEKLAKMQCGSVSLESFPGSGSKFTVSLPSNLNYKKNNDKTGNEISIPNLNKDIYKQKTIMNEEPILTAQLISKYLSNYNIQNTIHSQGEGTIDKIISYRPNIIILDIILPDMIGWQVLTEIKRKNSTTNIPVIVISVVDEASKGLELGADCYLLKPVSEHQLMLAVKQEIKDIDSNTRVLIVMSDKITSIKQMYSVLLVDDNENNINYIMDSLIAHDYRVIVARSGLEAIKRVKEDKPDMIIIDHQMSIPDGYHAIMKIREKSEMIDIPIIVMSSLILPGDKEKFLASGADIFLPQPINLDLLHFNINEIRAKILTDNFQGE